MNELVYASAITNSINEDNFFKVSNFKKNEIIGYLGKVDDKCLKELRVLAVTKFPWI